MSGEQEKTQATKPDAVALVDMDGTLADFDGSMSQWMERIGSPPEIAVGRHYFQEQSEEPIHIRERRRMIKRQPGFWSGLEELEVGMTIFSYLVKLKFNISILTKAPKHNEAAWMEKVQWCNKHLPMHDAVGMNIVTDKSLVYGKVLVDDWPAYVAPWLERRPRGLVLLPAQPWNEGFEVGRKNVIRVSADNLHQAYSALEVIRETCLP